MIYTHIAQKDIPSIYELTLCADLDFLLSLLDTHIAHKKNSATHEVILCAYLDLLLLLIDTHIAPRIFHSFMKWSFVPI